MASSNVELVRSIYADWDRGDFRRADWAHPKIEFVTFDPLAGSSIGVPEMSGRWRAFLDAWSEFRTQAEEYRELDKERVLVFHQFLARGKGSGLDVGPMRTKGASLFYIRGGRVTKLVLLPTPEQAWVYLGDQQQR